MMNSTMRPRWAVLFARKHNQKSHQLRQISLLHKQYSGSSSKQLQDDLDHAMGFVFADRSALSTSLPTMAFEIDGSPAALDPEALQLSFYAPEAIDRLDKDELIVCHGARRQAELNLQADVEPPFDASLLTLSFLHYPDCGYILIDLDYDGHDELQFNLGDPTYLEPRFFEKDHFNDATT